MSPIVSFGEEEFLRGKIVAPAWYLMRIDEVTEKPSKAGDSTNYVIEGIILKNAQDDSTDYAGVPITWMFNSKAMGFMIGFLQSLGVDVKPGMRIELAAAQGKELQVYVENKTFEGRLLNAVNHKYKPVA